MHTIHPLLPMSPPCNPLLCLDPNNTWCTCRIRSFLRRSNHALSRSRHCFRHFQSSVVSSSAQHPFNLLHCLLCPFLISICSHLTSKEIIYQDMYTSSLSFYFLENRFWAASISLVLLATSTGKPYCSDSTMFCILAYLTASIVTHVLLRLMHQKLIVFNVHEEHDCQSTP